LTQLAIDENSPKQINVNVKTEKNNFITNNIETTKLNIKSH